MLFELDAKQKLGKDVGHQLFSGTVEDIDDTFFHLILHEVETDREVLSVSNALYPHTMAP